MSCKASLNSSEERLVLRKDVFQECLVLYPESVWFKTQNQLRRRLNKWNAKHQDIFRQFVSDAEIMIPDGNGRILLPKRYLQMAGIQSDVRFIGVDNTIEIWAKEKTGGDKYTSLSVGLRFYIAQKTYHCYLIIISDGKSTHFPTIPHKI